MWYFSSSTYLCGPGGGRGGWLAIQSASLATTTLSFSDAHPNRRSQFLSSITSAPSAPSALEIFDAAHVASSFVKSRGTVSASPHTSWRLRKWIFHGWDTHVGVLVLEDLCNRSPGFCALVVRKETPFPLPVGCLMDSLLELTRKHCVVIAPSDSLVLLLSAWGSPDLPGGPFRLGVSHQARIQTPLPEVHAPRDPGPDLSGPSYAQHICKNDVGKDERSLRVPGIDGNYRVITLFSLW